MLKTGIGRDPDLREGAVFGVERLHVRRALTAGCTPEEIRHVILLSATTIGFPSMMAALNWANKELA